MRRRPPSNGLRFLLPLIAILVFAPGLGGCSKHSKSGQPSAHATRSGKVANATGGHVHRDARGGLGDGARHAGHVAVGRQPAAPRRAKRGEGTPGAAAVKPTARRPAVIPRGAGGDAGANHGIVRRRRERARQIAILARRNEAIRRSKLGVAAADHESPRAAAAAQTAHPQAGVRTGARRATPRPLNIARFLTLPDVRRITGDATLALDGSLSGIPASATYNSRYFAPPMRADYGVALQIWKETTRRASTERYRRMRGDYPNAKDTPNFSPRSFFSHFNDVMTLSFAELAKRTIVTVSCNQNICTPGELLTLANTAKGRL